MVGTKEGSTPSSDSQPSTWMRGPGLCAGLLGSREWEEGVADPLFSEAQEQSILFLRNVIVFPSCLSIGAGPVHQRKHQRQPQDSETCGRRLELSVLMTPERREPQNKAFFLPPIQPPQHRGSSRSGDTPSSQTPSIQKPF